MFGVLSPTTRGFADVRFSAFPRGIPTGRANPAPAACARPCHGGTLDAAVSVHRRRASGAAAMTRGRPER
jgi:hypothetical protein